MAIPTFENSDLDNPREHVLPALVHLPGTGGAATVTHPLTLEEWSEHLTKCGYYNTEWLIEKYADENGMIRASDLPVRTIKFIPPLQGPQSTINPGSKWIPRGDPEPARPDTPDLSRMTPEQLSLVLAQMKDIGLVTDKAETIDTAEVLNG